MNTIIARTGLTTSFVRELSVRKHEPSWMTQLRLDAFECAQQAKVPSMDIEWEDIPFEQIRYYVAAYDDHKESPEQSAVACAGYGMQQESDVIYRELQSELEQRGVVFCSMDDALVQHEQLVRAYFGTVVSMQNNVFAALNTAVWSGGVFIYVPVGIKVSQPLLMHYVLAQRLTGQFERTLCVLGDHSSLEYREGCGATFSCDANVSGSVPCAAVHAAVVEVVVGEGAHMEYSTLQRWSLGVATLTSKRAHLAAHATINWYDINHGSQLLVKNPTVLLNGEGAHASLYSISFAHADQSYNTGGRIVCHAPHTRGTIVSKTIASDRSRTNFKGNVECCAGATGAQAYLRCDSLLRSTTAQVTSVPCLQSSEISAQITHEATIKQVDEDALFYCMSRGFTREAAEGLLIRGFVETILSKLPADIALEVEPLI